VKKIKSKKNDETFVKLFKSAQKVIARAYSPYSKVKVASSVLMSDGKIYSGCNIENASYGGTICAERVAITKAISEGSKKIKSILVTTNQKEIWPPCGMCRQVIAEFASANTSVYCSTLDGNYTKSKFSEIFPSSFTGAFLKASR
jgi:cytidine deaminase